MHTADKYDITISESNMEKYLSKYYIPMPADSLSSSGARASANTVMVLLKWQIAFCDIGAERVECTFWDHIFRGIFF